MPVSGKVIRQTRTVFGFSAVALSGIGEVEPRQGSDESVTVVADDNVAPHLTTGVRHGVLYLGLSEDVVFAAQSRCASK